MLNHYSVVAKYVYVIDLCYLRLICRHSTESYLRFDFCYSCRGWPDFDQGKADLYRASTSEAVSIHRPAMSQDDQVLPAAAPAIAQDEVLLYVGPQSYSLPAVLSPPQIQLGTPVSASDSLQDMLPAQLRHWQQMILHCSGRQFLWIYQVRVNYDNENRPYMEIGRASCRERVSSPV